VVGTADRLLTVVGDGLLTVRLGNVVGGGQVALGVHLDLFASHVAELLHDGAGGRVENDDVVGGAVGGDLGDQVGGTSSGRSVKPAAEAAVWSN